MPSSRICPVLLSLYFIGTLGPPAWLAVRCIDSQGTEQRVHAEGACFVGHDGNDALADAFSTGQVAQEAHEAIVVLTDCLPLPSSNST